MTIKIRPEFIIFLIFPFLAFSQTNLTYNYNLTATGKNVSLLFSKVNIQENEFGIGLRYNINSLKHPDDQFSIFYKRLYATKPLHHFGLEAFYHKRIVKKWNTVKPFIFYNFQLSYSKLRSRWFNPVSFNENGILLYEEKIDFFGPYLWVEQSLGLGFNAKLNNNFFITSKLGFEVMQLSGNSEKEGLIFDEKYIREFGYQFSFGIGYVLKSRKK